MMIVKTFPSGPFETNAYVISSDTQALIIDPAPSSQESICTYLTNNHLTPTLIVLTHSHWDHIADTAYLKNKFKIPVWIHPLDAPNLQNPGMDRLPCWIEIEGVEPNKLLKEGDLIPLGEDQFKVIWTPGHSPGGICLYCEKQGVLISGDTLFKGSIGNLSFPTAQPDLMWESLDKLSKLPSNTQVYPGHGPATRIGDEAWLPDAKKYFNN